MATGAGAASRVTIGIVVFWGLIFSTLLTLFVVPVVYDLLARYTGSPGELERRLETLDREVPNPETATVA
jgi:multidrug efflux pump